MLINSLHKYINIYHCCIILAHILKQVFTPLAWSKAVWGSAPFPDYSMRQTRQMCLLFNLSSHIWCHSVPHNADNAFLDFKMYTFRHFYSMNISLVLWLLLSSHRHSLAVRRCASVLTNYGTTVWQQSDILFLIISYLCILFICSCFIVVDLTSSTIFDRGFRFCFAPYRHPLPFSGATPPPVTFTLQPLV